MKPYDFALVVWCDPENGGRARWDIWDGSCRVCTGWIPVGEEAGETLGRLLKEAMQPGVTHNGVKKILKDWLRGPNSYFDEDTGEQRVAGVQ